MPKKKKTLKQKKLADVRRSQEPDVFKPPVSENLTQTSTPKESMPLRPITSPQTASRHAISTVDYGYLGPDLLKTSVVTCVIVIVELLLHFIGRGAY